ncbi:MAG: metal-dependent transcriptional regulator [Candidatus Eremiobacteraeota bacterium]|nr:metal-dependent transcriptional regulator [Candidatus Eremiobacteraeota bacterium]
MSPNVEMYLKTLVRLYGGDAPVSTAAVAKELSVSSPSASTMLKRLDADGFVSHEGRHGVVPTELGRRIGAVTLRRQLLAERLLVDHLGVPWEIAASEACRLEHAVSPLVERRLADFLGTPSTCPHGHPIPLEDGRLWRHERTSALSELDTDAVATVVAVQHDMPELLKFLADIALRPGTEVRVLQRDRVVGLLTVAVDGAERVVSFQLANAILTQGVPQTAARKERANVTPISTARGAV